MVTTQAPRKVPTSFLVGTILQWFLGILWGILATVFYCKMRNDMTANDMVMFEKHKKNWKTCLWIAIIVQIVAIIIYCFIGLGQS